MDLEPDSKGKNGPKNGSKMQFWFSDIYSLSLDSCSMVLDLRNWTNKQIEPLRGPTKGYWSNKRGVWEPRMNISTSILTGSLLSIHILAMVFQPLFAIQFIDIAHKMLKICKICCKLNDYPEYLEQLTRTILLWDWPFRSRLTKNWTIKRNEQLSSARLST